MKNILLILIVCLVGAAANAIATPLIGSTDSGYIISDNSRGEPADSWNSTYGGYSGSEYTGYYLGTVNGNNSVSDLEALISYYLDTPYSLHVEKIDEPDTSSGDFMVTYDTLKPGETDEYVAGTWSTLGSDPAVAVNFYSVKGANSFALYYVAPALQLGDWVTYHLANNGGNPAVSHISASLVPVATPVPEPATMLLFGAGLAGLASVQLKKQKK